jgi:hypothetical protein
MPNTPYFHADSGTVRFWIEIDGAPVGATVSRETLHYRYRPGAQDEDPLETYTANALHLAAAVRHRVRNGSIEPVMLREFDLREPAAA